MTVKDGLAYIHLFSPCPTGWRFPSDRGIEVGRLAVETGFFPLWEMERGVYRTTVEVKEPKPLEEYLRTMGKYEHLTKKQTDEIKRVIERRRNVLNSLIGG
jgi:pyruvate/2-oxoacid:ferredoxin oxidoreductase beta subunit